MAQTTEPNEPPGPVSGLPAEVFCKILLAACERTDGEYDHMFSMVLAAVSQEWRAFVLSFPCIWTSLCVALDGPVSMTGIRVFLNRSKAMPLDIVLHYPETSQGHELEVSHFATLIETLLGHVARWRSLKLYLRSETALKTALKSLKGAADKLEELVLHISGLERYVINPVIPTFELETPTIRHLHISGGAAVRLLKDSFWPHNIKTLVVLGVTDASDIGVGAVFAFIRHKRLQDTLEVLEIDGGLLGSQIPEGRHVLPKLKKIRLKHCFAGLSFDLTHTNLEAPNLEILETVLDSPHHNYLSFPEEQLFALAWQPFDPNTRFPSLRTFRVVGPFGLGGCLGCLEHCEHLAVSGIRNVAGMLDRLGRDSDDISCRDLMRRGYIQHLSGPLAVVKGWFCTHLRSLEIHHCDGLDPTQLRETLGTRRVAIGPRSPVNTISSLTVYDERKLPEADKVWFQENLEQFQWITETRAHG